MGNIIQGPMLKLDELQKKINSFPATPSTGMPGVNVGVVTCNELNQVVRQALASLEMNLSQMDVLVAQLKAEVLLPLAWYDNWRTMSRSWN